MKIRAELCYAEKKLGRRISCERGGKFAEAVMARPKLFVNRVL